MIRNLLLVLFTLQGILMFWQLSFDSEIPSFKADSTVNRAEFHFTITNEGSTNETFWWTVDRRNSPEEWVYAVCDINQCYVDGLESCPCSIPNILGPGESFEFRLFLMANKTTGSSDINFNVVSYKDSDSCEGQEVKLKHAISLTSTSDSSTDSEESDQFELNVYPNPTTDVFQIKNDVDVDKIVVSNIIGKKVIETQHYKGETHQISQLDKGIYLVRMIDKNSNILGVKRITVE